MLVFYYITSLTLFLPFVWEFNVIALIDPPTVLLKDNNNQYLLPQMRSHIPHNQFCHVLWTYATYHVSLLELTKKVSC